ncbi:hypothetical protein [Piscinibacter koreensis]|uniref:Uncharacterized protein n=1 Tax=Piscinibacter koreensis TaxID=2742824 RepID=A0A7Y6NTS4_9BURK|nr:hypothetical protein [Schlegelella koreensis]NUZ09052.1 hypothetical protein [Schlegelella koreensis]
MKFRRSPTLRTADDFISAAGAPIQTRPEVEAGIGLATPNAVLAVPPAPPNGAQEGNQTRPWEGKRADKQTEVFNLRLTEVELEKLRFIAANTPDSMQAFIRKTLLPAIEAKLDQLV